MGSLEQLEMQPLPSMVHEISYLWIALIKLIEDNLDEIISLCKAHQVQSISLFGSAVRDSMNENSDIDFLVQFSDDIDVLYYADNYFSFLEKLEKLTGKKVDLVSRKSLKNPILIQEIDRSKLVLYAA